jgi:ABC-type bacteriocin/lantibiotic exporter with double-glycine peptidase domain
MNPAPKSNQIAEFFAKNGVQIAVTPLLAFATAYSLIFLNSPLLGVLFALGFLANAIVFAARVALGTAAKAKISHDQA